MEDELEKAYFFSAQQENVIDVAQVEEVPVAVDVDDLGPEFLGDDGAEEGGGDLELAERPRFGEDLPAPLAELPRIGEDVQAELSRIGEDSVPKRSAACR